MSTVDNTQEEELPDEVVESAADTGPSFLDMSDEDIANYDPSTLTPIVTADNVNADEDAAKDVDEVASDGEDDAGEGAEGDDTPEVDKPASEATEAEVKDTKAEAEVEKPTELVADIDYKAAYEKLFAPFKANGREVAIKNVDDAVALMQMGANYNKKMAALKPNLKLMKLLEVNNLLDETKLSFLIDLDKKDPDAISKLVKDSGISPLDMEDNASAYKPKTYAVDDREIELDTVLDEIHGTAGYTQTLEIVSNKWDGASKKVIAETPQVLKIINSHVELGIYDLIAKEVENERLFGRLNGLSDIDAYRQVGDGMNAQGKFNHLVNSKGNTATAQANTQTGTEQPVAGTIVAPKPKTSVDDGKLNDKRRAASSTTPTTATTVAKEFNPLSMSDEEFAKVATNRF